MATALDELDSVVKTGQDLAKTPKRGLGASGRGAPAVSVGEQVNKSRPLRMTKLLGLISGKTAPESAKLEGEYLRLVRKGLNDTNVNPASFDSNSFALPFSWSHLPDEFSNSESGLQAKSMAHHSTMAGMSEFDPDEVRWLEGKLAGGMVRKSAGTMSSLDDSIGGALVGPPTQGELIPLMRNKAALLRAGAQTAPFAQSGRMVFPRETSAPTAFWVAENGIGTPEVIGTGTTTAQAKKLRTFVKLPNELFKFASVAADAMVQRSMSTSLSLGLDYAGLYGPGSNGAPLGIKNYTGTNEIYDYTASTPAPAGIGANGNAVKAEDGDAMLGVLEDRNFDLDTGFKWIMRGRMMSRVRSIGADALSAGDEAGAFKTDRDRAAGYRAPRVWAGQEVITTAQVANSYTKGSGTGLTEIFGGMWNYCMMFMHGALEINSDVGGQTLRLADQTLFTATMHADIIYQYPGAFCMYQLLKVTK